MQLKDFKMLKDYKNAEDSGEGRRWKEENGGSLIAAKLYNANKSKKN